MTPDPASSSVADVTRDVGPLPQSETGHSQAVEQSPVFAPPGFVLERELGVGGMGVVYLARQTGLNRLVALKLVKAGGAIDPKALIRFLAEAEAVASVRHPNVVEVHQYGEHAGRPYLALEYCPGGDLTGLAPPTGGRDAVWFRTVAELMTGIAAGVQAAHAVGIVHRDLKPHNILMAADGTPKVADFGLAKRGVGSDLTKSGTVMGTPAYMSPEQAKGETKFVGPEADVWALGVILYELCCGERPTDTGGPVMEALARVARAEVTPLLAKGTHTPAELAFITHKCLAADPRDRYPTAGRLADDLRNWLAGKPISARPAGAVESAVKWVKRNPGVTAWAGGTLAALAVAAGVSAWWAVRASHAEADTATQLRRTQDAEATATAALADSTRLAEELKMSLAESRRRTALNYLAYGQLCAAASRTANVTNLADAHEPMAEYTRTAAWVSDTADPEIVAAIVKYDAALQQWSAGPPPADLRRASLTLAQACRNSWLTGVERDFPDLAANIRQKVYQRATGAADGLLAAEPTAAVTARRQVWELYWGELAVVESKLVESAMIRLGQLMEKWEADGKPPADLPAAVAALRTACAAEKK